MATKMTYDNELRNSDYSDGYRKSFPERNAVKMEREWTKSEHVRELFDVIYEIYDLPTEVNVNENRRWHSEWCAITTIGYINAKGKRKGYGARDDKSGIGLEWDVRYNIAGGNKVPITTDLSPDRRWLEDRPDLPECYTDYADTIFVIDNPAVLDVLIATGHYKMPKSAKGEVFLAMSPTFVEAHPEVSKIVDAAKLDGKVFDVRDWYAAGLLEPADEHSYKTPINWLGEMPDEVAEPKLAAKLSEVVSSVRGSVITGYRSDKWGRIKDVQSCLNVANALALDPEFITLPTIARGKKLSSNGKWAKFEKANRIYFKGDGYSKRMREIDKKIDDLDEIIRFWSKAREDYRFSILLDEDDFCDKDFVFEKISVLGRLIGVDDYVDTFNFGVEADDILA